MPTFSYTFSHALAGATLALTLAAPMSLSAQDAPQGGTATPSPEADALIANMRTLFRGQMTQESVDSAEGLLTRIDRMEGATAAQKVAAHAVLNGFYRGADVDAAIEAHSRAIMALAPQLDSAQRVSLSGPLTSAYVNLAEVFGDEGRADDALALLRKAPEELTGVPNVATVMAPVIARYEMVGKSAPYIEAEYWINAPAGKKRIDFPTSGKVTVIEHTAWWCGPCRKSYAPIARVAKEIGADKVRVIFATQLMGMFKQERNLTPDVELAKLTDYFVKEHKIPFEIAVSSNVPPEEARANAKRYNCSGIPHIVVIDKTGNVRRIMIGWDVGNEARLEDAIRALL